MDKPSKSQVRKAGSTIRRYQRGEATVEEYERALDVVAVYQDQLDAPMAAVEEGLRELLVQEDFDAEFSSRIKRTQTIVEKLSGRESQLSLDRMVDLAGCRIVLQSDDVAELRRLEYVVREQWREDLWEQRCKDYVTTPRDSGYRAVHLVVRHEEFPVEIQLRTHGMHAWAQEMERLSYLFEENFKQDGGAGVVQRYGQLLSRQICMMETGLEETPSWGRGEIAEFAKLHGEVQLLEHEKRAMRHTSGREEHL